MPTRNISLTEHLDRFIDELVASGRYESASEVHRAALRLLERSESELQLRCQVLQTALEGAYRGERVVIGVEQDADGASAVGRAMKAKDDQARELIKQIEDRWLTELSNPRRKRSDNEYIAKIIAESLNQEGVKHPEKPYWTRKLVLAYRKLGGTSRLPAL